MVPADNDLASIKILFGEIGCNPNDQHHRHTILKLESFNPTLDNSVIFLLPLTITKRKAVLLLIARTTLSWSLKQVQNRIVECSLYQQKLYISYLR
jgi:hypothetical protein